MKRFTTMLAVIILLLSAVGGSASAVTIRHLGSNNDKLDAWQEELARRFEAKTGIKVQVETAHDTQVAQKLTVAVAADLAPDTVSLITRDLTQFSIPHTVEDLRPWIEKDGLSTKDYPAPIFNAVVLPENTAKPGMVVGLPHSVWTEGCAYNLTLLNEAGLQPPAPDWTWDDLAMYVRKLANNANPDGKVTRWGFNLPFQYTRFSALISHGGGQYLDSPENPTKSLLLSQPVYDSLAYVQRLSESGNVDFGWSANWWKGVVGITYNIGANAGITRELQKADFDMRWHPFAKGPTENRGGELSVQYTIMLQSSRHKEEAWQWIKFLAHNMESQVLLGDITQRIPATTYGMKMYFAQMAKAYDASINYMLEQVVHPSSFPRWEPGHILLEIDKWLMKALQYKNISLNEALIQADAIANTMLADWRKK